MSTTWRGETGALAEAEVRPSTSVTVCHILAAAIIVSISEDLNNLLPGRSVSCR